MSNAHPENKYVTRSWTSSISTYIIVGSCNSYLTTSKHDLLNITGLQLALPINQLFEIYLFSCLITQHLSKLDYDSLGCHLLWWHWLILQFFQKLLNDSGLHEMVLLPFRCVVHSPSVTMETYKPNLLTLGQFIRQNLEMADHGNVTITQIRIGKIIIM